MTLHTKLKTYSLAAIMLIGGMLTSCEDDLNVGKEGEGSYTLDGVGVFAINQEGKKDMVFLNSEKKVQQN